MAITITDIKPFKGSHEEAFEELACQVTRRTRTKGNPSWIRLHGAGGDGGVEALWEEKSCKHGLQAKWFLKTANIGWAQIEKSFKTAIKIHPDLSHYHIFLSCDLTGPTGRKKKGNTPASNGVQQWNHFKEKLTAFALTQSITIDIHLKTLSDLLTDISKPECIGLQEFWFGQIEINNSKLKDWYETAQTDLGERYCSTDNVQVSASSAFKGLIRDTKLQNEIRKIKLKYNSTGVLNSPNFAGVNCERSANNVEVLLRDLLNLTDGLATNLDVALPYAELRASLRNTQEAFQKLQRIYWDIDTNDFSDAQKNEMSDFRKSIRKREDICDKLDALLSTDWVKSEETRALLLVGPAGIGKSHLLADQVRQEIEDGGTALLFLGHWFSSPQAWETIASRLGKPNFNKDQLLGAINSRADAKGRRAIIAIDALNESIGGNWIRGLCSFAEDILKYPNVTLVVSCRDVYVPYVIPANFYGMANKITLLGFVSEDEVENAAKIFLDKRGIVRPALLWIAPEFSNPLFLKASALALHKVGKTEFPKGLQGSKEVFSFFIKSIGASLGTPYDGSSAFLNILRVCLSSLAKGMADAKDDSIDESIANQIIENTFKPYPLRTGWLDTLCKGGLLDCYPTFEEDPDPFNPPANKIRFAYQRLQDHLMAEALLRRITKPNDLFNGLPESLNFITSERKHLDWRYWGLMEALSIQVAEKFGVEILDYYLDYVGDDFVDHSLSQAFVGSVRWRNSNAISDRTVELLHTCSRDDRELLSLIVEFTFRDGHRLNADKLHKVLSDMSLPERDAYWTVSISKYFEETVFERLLLWTINAEKAALDTKYLYKAANTIAWMLSSTSQYVRDNATKALSSIYVDCPGVFPWLVERFKNVDDPYISERIFLSGYGYLLRTGNEVVFEAYANAVAYIFETKRPVTQLYIRDYARSIIELAHKAGAYTNSIPLDDVRPPYSSTPPCFNATETQVEKIAKKRGGNQIMRSCSGMLSDFKKYELDSDMGSFIKVPLSKEIPLTIKERMEAYEESLDTGSPVKELLDELTGKNKPTVPIRFVLDSFYEKQSDEELEKLKKQAIKFQETILIKIKAILTPDEWKYFKKEWLVGFQKQYHERNNRPKFDNNKIGYWVARRAYAYGWTEQRFGKDNMTSYSDYSRSRPPVERVGKKYQWLARSELLARLTDNYWLSAKYEDEKFRPYNHPLDLGYERDIDPTLFDHPSFQKDTTDHNTLAAPTPKVDAVDGFQRLDWSFRDSPAATHFKERLFSDAAGTEWIRLSWFAITRRRNETREGWGHNLVQEEFYFLNSTILAENDGQKLIRKLQSAGAVDIDKFKPKEYTDYPYLYECGKLEIWPNITSYNQTLFWPEEDNYELFDLVEEYAWESHLDKTMPKGQRVQTLASWILQDYKLRRSVNDPNLILDSKDDIVARYISRQEEEDADTYGDVSYGIIAKANLVQQILADKNKTLYSILTGERQAWPDGANMGATTWRRFNAMGLGIKPDELTSWDEDTDQR